MDLEKLFRKIKTEWVGFCQYRKFFVTQNIMEKEFNFENFKKLLVYNVDGDLQNYDCILGKNFQLKIINSPKL